MPKRPLTMEQALAALDAGNLQWRYGPHNGHSEWRLIRRDEHPRFYPRNPDRVSVVIESPSWASFATGGMCDGLDQGELNRHPTRYRIVEVK